MQFNESPFPDLKYPETTGNILQKLWRHMTKEPGLKGFVYFLPLA